jgi:hypothetical protein
MQRKGAAKKPAKWAGALLCSGVDYLWVAPNATRSTREYDRFSDPADFVAKYSDPDHIFR